MIIRTIIYVGIIFFFIWDMKKDPKSFKKYIFPIIGITYFAGTPYFLTIDDRIQLTTKVLTFLFTAFYLWSYYKDYKVERFREKRRLREIRDRQREEDNQVLLEEMIQAKNTARKTKSTSYEFTLDLPKSYEQLKGQTSLFGDSNPGRPYEDYKVHVDKDQDEEKEDQVLDNQIDIFHLN